MVVPGSAQVKRQAEAEGLDRVFVDAGFEWRRAGCSMCLGMNPDVLAPGERCASTSNRNFEGRQGAGGRTHLVSPAVAAATAIAGHFTDGTRPGGAGVKAVSPVTSRAAVLDRAGRRHRPDHPEAVPEAHRAHRLRRVPLLRLAQGSGVRAEPAGGEGRANPDRRPELRLRLVARARAVGARGLRLRCDRRAVVRRHLPAELAQDRAAAGALPAEQVKELMTRAQAGEEITVDLEARTAGGYPVRARRPCARMSARGPRRHRADAARGRRRSPPTKRRTRR